MIPFNFFLPSKRFWRLTLIIQLQTTRDCVRQYRLIWLKQTSIFSLPVDCHSISEYTQNHPEQFMVTADGVSALALFTGVNCRWFIQQHFISFQWLHESCNLRFVNTRAVNREGLWSLPLYLFPHSARDSNPWTHFNRVHSETLTLPEMKKGKYI